MRAAVLPWAPTNCFCSEGFWQLLSPGRGPSGLLTPGRCTGGNPCGTAFGAALISPILRGIVHDPLKLCRPQDRMREYDLSQLMAIDRQLLPAYSTSALHLSGVNSIAP